MTKLQSHSLRLLVLGLGLGLAWWPAGLIGQTLGPGTLPQRQPKTPEVAPAPAPAVPPAAAAEAEPEEEVVLVPKLKGILFVNSVEEVQAAAAADFTGVRAQNIPLLSGKDFEKRLGWYIGQKLTLPDIHDIERETILYCREKGHPLVDVVLPEQEPTLGVIKFILVEGKVGAVTVENPGRKWFSDDLIRHQVRLQPGDTVDMAKLRPDMDWVNRNPFRQVNTIFKAGTNVGLSDVTLHVEDRLPVRLYAGYENSGTKFTGADRVLAGFNWGNAFGLDQQFNYQYTTDVDFKRISAHSGSYLIPLPWRHNLALFGAYAETTVENIQDVLNANGKSYQGSLRYTIPRRVSQDYIHELSAGFDYKRTDNDFEFGGVTGLNTTKVDVDQFQAGYSGLLADNWGQTSFGVEGYFSPGDLTDHNNKEDFNLLREGSKAKYVYGRLNVDRIVLLPAGFSWLIHFGGQYSSDRLTPSEEIGIGGYGTVRGYGERAANGDYGFVVNNELRTKPFSLGSTLLQPLQGVDRLQFLAFLDYGRIYVKDYNTSDIGQGLPQHLALASAGLGLRYTVRQNLSVRFDYGFQLTEREQDKSSGGHVGVLVSF